jgi:hypothetical protein
MHIQLTTKLGLAVVALAALLYYLYRNANQLAPRKFIGLSVLAGALGVAVIGGFFRTATFASFFEVSQLAIVEKQLSWVKAFIALTAAALSLYAMGRAAEKKPLPLHWLKGGAFALAVLSVGAYYRFGDFGYANFYHRWEFYHYYLGSKYDRELGYERLYTCTAIAQADLGMGNEVRSRKLRDLSEDLLIPASTVLEHPEQCKDRFTPERWEAYKADVNFFRHSANIQYWNDMQKDHGYNPPPVWTVMGHLLASIHPASDGFFKLLALIDPMFFVGMFAAIYWAFGWRVCSVAAIFWGCQLPAEYFWTGGAFMRQDWLFYLVLSGCLLRKRYFAFAGASFAYSVLLRAFPAVFVAGWVVVMITYAWKHRHLPFSKWFHPSHLRLVGGGVLAGVILISISIAFAGKNSYAEFAKHIRVHNSTPLTNNMGLATVISHGPSGRMEYVRDEKLLDPFGPWKQMRRDRLDAFFFLRIVLWAGLGLAFVRATRRLKSLWIAQSLSVGIVVCLLEMTCYYYSMFILAAFLARLRKGFEQALLATAGVSQLLAVNRIISYYYDDRYTAQSALFVVFPVALIIAFWPAPKSKAETSSKKPDLPAGPDAVQATDKTAAQA